MAEDKPLIQVDDDWKKQAQAEKARLEEEERKRREQQQEQPAMPMGAVASATAPGAAPAGAAPQAKKGKGRQIPPASIESLVHSLVTQTLFYLGDLATSGGESLTNMDMAKHQLDTLAVLEEKTKGNLTPEEQGYIDTAIYEARMRFISVAGQIIAGA